VSYQRVLLYCDDEFVQTTTREKRGGFKENSSQSRIEPFSRERERERNNFVVSES
jgi:hypothetical protein